MVAHEPSAAVSGRRGGRGGPYFHRRVPDPDGRDRCGVDRHPFALAPSAGVDRARAFHAGYAVIGRGVRSLSRGLAAVQKILRLSDVAPPVPARPAYKNITYDILF